MIDWTKPVICASGMDADPLFDGQGRVQACRIGSVVYAPPAFEKLGLRNAPAKPVRHEARLALYDNVYRTVVSTQKGPFSVEAPAVEVRHIVWNSDGSPVEEEKRIDEYKADRDFLSQKYQDMIADRDQWRSKAKSLQAEVDRLIKIPSESALRRWQMTSDEPVKNCKTCRFSCSREVTIACMDNDFIEWEPRHD